MRAGAQCYLCERPIQDGDPVVVYHDTRFWEQALVYHATCWQDADLPAKAYPDSVCEAPAFELPAAAGCPVCGEPIEDGDSVVRTCGAKRRRGGKVYHGRCFEARAHA